MMDLRLDTKEGAFADRGGYQVIIPGNAAQSRLFQRVSAKDKTRMPPPDSERQLTRQQIETIRLWIDQGARWETHWAFQPPVRPRLPDIQDKSWPLNPIDYFILARLEREGLRPSPAADKVTLLRRLTFDLTGLPPLPAEVDAFLADDSPKAYEKVVDRLLNSPRYGERMAMQWLDLARYADTHGYHIDSHRDMWPWRDWVIEAFNRNMPFDQFTIEQLAGDLLPNPTRSQMIATGFNRNHMINFEGGAVPEEYHVEYVVDRAETTSTVWMALTMGCARCHDHKYDPIRQKDFYRFFAFFNNVPEKGLDGELGNAEPKLPLPSQEQAAMLGSLEQRIKEVEEPLRDSGLIASLRKWQATRLDTLPDPSRRGLVAHYEWDDNLEETSGARQHAKAVRGEVLFEAGPVAKAADFSGETHVQLGDSQVLNLQKPFSLTYWMRVRSRHKAMVLVQKQEEGESRRGLEVFLDDSVPIPNVLRKGSHLFVRLIHEWPQNAVEIRTKDVLMQGDWHHIVINYDGSGRASGIEVFIDATPKALEVLRDSLSGSVNAEAPLEIGNKKKGRPYTGQVDDLRVYAHPLPTKEIEILAKHLPIRKLLAQSSNDDLTNALLPRSEGRAKQQEQSVGEGDRKEDKLSKERSARHAKLVEYFLTYDAPEKQRRLYAELNDLKKKKVELERTIPTTMVMKELGSSRSTFILARGDYRNPTEKVSAGVPSVLSPLSHQLPSNRLGLAKWLLDPQHPLTARVVVNRYWQMYFGTGIVKTAEDFGSQGEAPTNPELLDWLSTEFIRTGWDIRSMQRLIVTSATYRQSSRVTPSLLDKDPENQLLARGPRLRLPAEFVRDNALAISGLMNHAIGGPSVFPYQPEGIWEELAFGEGFSAQRYTPSAGADLYRRSMYTFWKRTVPPPSLAAFDAPDREKCTTRRPLTNTPLQALVLLNDPAFVEASRALAARMLTAAGKNADERIRFAFRLATARQPEAKEVQVLQRIYQEALNEYRRDKSAALELVKVGQSGYDRGLDVQELAAWTSVASTILNLDETITKE